MTGSLCSNCQSFIAGAVAGVVAFCRACGRKARTVAKVGIIAVGAQVLMIGPAERGLELHVPLVTIQQNATAMPIVRVQNESTAIGENVVVRLLPG